MGSETSKEPQRLAVSGPAEGARLREEIYGRLREEIVTLRRPPGTPLSDKTIAAEFAASRTPVREALLRLADEGLVEVFPNSGTFVTKIQSRALENAQFVRSALERAAIRQTAGNITSRDLVQLSDIVKHQEDVIATSQTKFYELDEEFHRSLFSLSGHADAWPIALKAKAQLDRVRYLSLTNTDRLKPVVAEHRSIIESLSQGDADLAERRMEEHLSAAFQNVVRAVTLFQQYFSIDSNVEDRRRKRQLLR